MRVCAVVCSNGWGHLRRVVPVMTALAARAANVRIDVRCAPWQLRALHTWPSFRGAVASPRLSFLPFESYPRWSSEPGYYRNRLLLQWHEELRSIDLASYDLVISDNLVEALDYSERVVLMGSFLWHDVYRTQFGDEPVVRDYWKQCVGRLQRRPAMIANRYFAMPAVREQTCAVEVGMLPSALPCGKPRNRTPRSVLFVSTTVEPLHAELVAFLRTAAASTSRAAGMRVHFDRRLASEHEWPNHWKVFDPDADDLDGIDAIVARPGMGIVTDAIASARPLFCIFEPNPEMQANARVLDRLGLGRALADVSDSFDAIADFGRNASAQAQYDEAIAGLDAHGLEQTVENLLSLVV